MLQKDSVNMLQKDSVNMLQKDSINMLQKDSVNMLQNKWGCGMDCRDWHTSMHWLRLWRLVAPRPGHAGQSNGQAGRLASRAAVTTGPQTGMAEVLRILRTVLCKDTPDHYTTDHLNE